MSLLQRVSQGTLNRFRGSVLIPDFPNLNVTANFLGPAGITFAIQGEAVKYLPTLTGAITAPEPYLMAQITVNMLRTQSLANQYKAQMENDARIGDVTAMPDAPTVDPYTVSNCSIQSVREMNFNSTDGGGYTVIIGGYYLVNSSMWNLI
jgi:hypothetical protein